MPYFAVDDGMYDHPKFDGLSDAAVALWTKAGSWSSRYLTDGEVPTDRVKKLGYSEAVAEELVSAGLWHGFRSGVQSGFRFHEWGKHQSTKAEIEAKRSRWRDEKKNKAIPKSFGKPDFSGTESGADSGLGSECPFPSLPIPIKKRGANAPSQPSGSGARQAVQTNLAGHPEQPSPPSGAAPPSKPKREKRKPPATHAALIGALARAMAVPPSLGPKLLRDAGVRLERIVERELAPDLDAAADLLVAKWIDSGSTRDWDLCNVRVERPRALDFEPLPEGV